ncbi:PadR family transcriptional regulator [Lactococcus insecticola]|uniref:PadR family transcriptional regulator n=2 Tax=Pseudolactococcus insecticola TaxID=2709158 RepID=A0A6A0B4Y5_9LACT|nr:PadR family transcriptional regulator [Lactococcus insecticola]
MYELFILSKLLDGNYSAYKLKFVLEMVLGANRKMSFGVLYPLLDKLEKNQFVEMSDELDRRGKKLVRITDAGRERFQVLMREPVKVCAHLDDIYQFKLLSLRFVDATLQKSIISDYRAQKIAEKADYETHIHDLIEKHLGYTFYDQALQNYHLQLNLIETKLAWIDEIQDYYEKEN